MEVLRIVTHLIKKNKQLHYLEPEVLIFDVERFYSVETSATDCLYGGSLSKIITPPSNTVLGMQVALASGDSADYQFSNCGEKLHNAVLLIRPPIRGKTNSANCGHQVVKIILLFDQFSWYQTACF
jgi:hypothetical protein